MRNSKNVFVEEWRIQSPSQIINSGLTKGQKNVIKLLQNKEVIFEEQERILITSKTGKKKVLPPTLYHLINKGLVTKNTKRPASYVLSPLGRAIAV